MENLCQDQCHPHSIAHLLQINEARIADNARIGVENFKRDDIENHIKRQGRQQRNDTAQDTRAIPIKPCYIDSRQIANQNIHAQNSPIRQ